MVLKADLKHFLDEEGKVLELTKQAKAVFKFLSKIVSSVTEQIEQPVIEVDLKCSTRAEKLYCDGSIQATSTAIGLIEWHCDSCHACGTISNWQGSIWDKQERTLH
ncbi:hypothetical protein H4J38_05145 [Colwellia sp. BRX10-3]|uniref:hypothetical protein n=1 Tax=Colwellia sp. BRX10-3 TaxID=2759844 RepID=UPI0015F4746D|nr:hypothetical protein [Colwellia sp. BRX10-3]MBA6390168.1 hypothetical protein [Colwellia sp. BRX10-3]